jgi:SAM-dependent methyltransferase
MTHFNDSLPANLRVYKDRDFLAEFLERYWFAPPVALWRSIEAHALTAVDFPTPMLDFGCGDGLFTDAVFGKQPGIVGVDIATGELPDARDSGVYWRGVQFGDGHHLPYADGAFGSVYSNSVVEHIPDPENVIPELSRVLRKGGVLALTVPSDKFRALLDGVKNAPTPAEGEAYAKRVDKLLAHHHYKTPEQWAALLQKCGLRPAPFTYYIAPEAEQKWDQMNREYGIGGRSLFNTLASPKLKPFGFSAALKALVPTRLKPHLQKFYDAPANGEGGGLLVVGIKN